MDNLVPFLVPRDKRLGHAGHLIGFALGGFFDGILLHQVLQWHHLLSGITRAPFSDLRVQLMADGLFHAAMYVIAVWGIWVLVKARYLLVGPAADRILLADTLIGFGAWHIVDAILSHWILGIHRIRMDVPNPLIWDLLWLAVFGILFVAVGIILKRRHPPFPDTDPEQSKTRSTFAPALVLALAAAALVSALAPFGPRNIGKRNGTVTVLLRPGTSPAQLLAALPEVDGRMLWSSADGGVWMLVLGKEANPMRLYAHGAMLVSGTLLPAGCAAWLRT